MQVMRPAAGVTVFQSELYQTNGFVIETADLVLVVDPNYLPSEIDAIRTYVDEVKEERPVVLFFTHSDFDHIVGYGSFRDCRVIAGAAFANHPDPVERVEAVERLDDEFYIDRPYPIEYPLADDVIERDGDRLIVGETVLRFNQAYGHNGDGLMCFVEPLRLLITGDYVSDIEFPFVFDTFANYRATLSKIAHFEQDVTGLLLLPSHGSVTSDGGEIRKRIAVSEHYLTLCEELLGAADDSRFEAFMTAQGYRFKKGFRKRHEANMALLRRERETGILLQLSEN